MHDELKEYLDALAQGERYRVDATLKANPSETTERAFLILADGSEKGPFIRKRIALDSGLGDAYERIWQAQQVGNRFMHLPRIVECGADEGERIVVMEHVAGRTLEEEVQDPDFDDARAASIAQGLCDAVIELHECFDPPLIHRDLKPSNIIVSPSNLTLIDFGIARTFDEDAEKDTKNFGTRGYAPPEQFGYGQTDERSDVYALGMLIAYCCLREEPCRSLVEGGFDDERIPEAIRPVLRQATAFDPQARFMSVRELKSSLPPEFAPREQDAPPPPPSPPRVDALVDEPPSSMQESKQEERGSGLPLRIPRGVGIAWNVLVIVFWLLFVCAAVTVTVAPSETEQLTNPLARGICYFGIFVIGLGFVAYAIADRRPLRARFPKLARRSWLAESALCILAGFGIALLAAVMATALNLMFP